MSRAFVFNQGNFGTIKCPCRDCGNRTITCHGNCERYSEFLEHVARIRANKKEEEARDWDTYNENIDKFKRKRRLVK